MKEYHLDKLETKQSTLGRKMIRKTNTEEDMFYSYQNVEAVRKQLQHPDDIFQMILDVQKSCNSLLLASEQQRDEEWFDNLDHNICSFKQRIHSWIKDAELERHGQLRPKRSLSTKCLSKSR